MILEDNEKYKFGKNLLGLTVRWSDKPGESSLLRSNALLKDKSFDYEKGPFQLWQFLGKYPFEEWKKANSFEVDLVAYTKRVVVEEWDAGLSEIVIRSQSESYRTWTSWNEWEQYLKKQKAAEKEKWPEFQLYKENHEKELRENK